jgi:DNA (cytosine-5)-methyltransferase 1
VDHPINHISLCTGYGGIDLGLRSVFPTCRTVAAVEIEAFAIENLVAKMEAGDLDSAPVWTDLHTFPFAKFRGLVDILSGGFPCQPFSHAGSRLGVEDPRHLWPAIARGIGECRPTAVFFENVDGIASAKSPGYSSVLHHVLSDLESLGYRATAGLFTAQEVGSPHIRKRWFILGLADSNHADGEPTGKVRGGGCQRWEEPHRCGGLADSVCEGLERHTGHVNDSIRQVRRSQSSGPIAEGGLQARWPARPGDEQHEWEPRRTSQPRLGGNADGSAARVDRLRLLGNGVVPQVAARAFESLFEELKQVTKSKP